MSWLKSFANTTGWADRRERLQPFIPDLVPLLMRHGQLKIDEATENLWGTQTPSSSMSNSQQVAEQRKGRTGYDLRPS
jgi:hypothetical protein